MSKELQSLNLSPEINNLQPIGIDLIMDYWNPEQIGESKKVYFFGYQMLDMPDRNTGEAKPLECAILIEWVEGAGWTSIANGSVRLVSWLKRANIQKKDAIQITYRGKQQNKTNNNSSDTWSLHRLGPAD
jgi:hypothetical protein